MVRLVDRMMQVREDLLMGGKSTTDGSKWVQCSFGEAIFACYLTGYNYQILYNEIRRAIQ